MSIFIRRDKEYTNVFSIQQGLFDRDMKLKKPRSGYLNLVVYMVHDSYSCCANSLTEPKAKEQGSQEGQGLPAVETETMTAWLWLSCSLMLVSMSSCSMVWMAVWTC